jgi:hypothetical protein
MLLFVDVHIDQIILSILERYCRIELHLFEVNKLFPCSAFSVLQLTQLLTKDTYFVRHIVLFSPILVAP